MAKKITNEHFEIPEPKRFSVIRNFDENGISGVGRVLDGIVFHNGKVVVCWRTDAPNSESLHGHSSISLYDSFKGFKLIHIDSHPDNKTEIVWFTEEKKK